MLPCYVIIGSEKNIINRKMKKFILDPRTAHTNDASRWDYASWAHHGSKMSIYFKICNFYAELWNGTKFSEQFIESSEHEFESRTSETGKETLVGLSHAIYLGFNYNYIIFDDILYEHQTDGQTEKQFSILVARCQVSLHPQETWMDTSKTSESS